MRTFRLLLTLLLCLTVPVAGWASVLSGPLCPQLQHEHDVTQNAEHHSHASHAASESAQAEQTPQHYGDVTTPGKPCTGEHCGCGCGMGACSSPSLSVLAMMPADFLPLADKGLLPVGPEASVRVAFGTSLLRPPIS